MRKQVKFTMNTIWIILLCVCTFNFEFTHGYGLWPGEWMDGERCETAIKEIVVEDRETVVDNNPERLHSTWLSQECEVRAGPEYVIRKYMFFENGTFLLHRHHYAEESCSVATHTVVARGVIRLLSASGLAPGATEARYQLDHVHIVPLTRMVAHKFSHRMNLTCTVQPRWRPYTAQVIYEEPSQRTSNSLWGSPSPSFNAFQRSPPSKKKRGLDCLEALGIDFDELKLLRVQRKPPTTTAFGLGANGQPRVELLLGSLPQNVYSKKIHRSTSLQPTALLRMDTISGCLVCGTISRATEYSPPLLHEVVALPALLGGSWISSSCESCEGGLWIKRHMQFYSGDMLWAGRWDYYSDPKCANFLYAVTSAGSYIQRAGRQRRYVEEMNFPPSDSSRSKRGLDENKLLAEWMTSDLAKKLLDIYETKRDDRPEILPGLEKIHEIQRKTSTTTTTTTTTESPSDDQVTMDPLEDDSKLRPSLFAENSYKHLFQNAQPSMAESFTAMLRGNQRREDTTKPPPTSLIPSGTTELDLHVAESLLIAGDLSIAARCRAQIVRDEVAGLKVRPLSSWPRNCVRHALEAPSTMGLRARIGVNWSGQYTLLLGPRDDSLWEAPLRQCGPTPTFNPVLRSHLRQSFGYRYGLFVSSAAAPHFHSSTIIHIVLLFLYKLFR